MSFVYWIHIKPINITNLHCQYSYHRLSYRYIKLLFHISWISSNSIEGVKGGRGLRQGLLASKGVVVKSLRTAASALMAADRVAFDWITRFRYRIPKLDLLFLRKKWRNIKKQAQYNTILTKYNVQILTKC